MKFDREHIIFLDQGNWNSRIEWLLYFKDKAKSVILHDSDFYSTPREPSDEFYPSSVLGKQISPLVYHEKAGASDWSEHFKHWKEIYPPLPWCCPTGPSTLIGSNFEPVPDVDMSITEI